MSQLLSLLPFGNSHFMELICGWFGSLDFIFDVIAIGTIWSRQSADCQNNFDSWNSSATESADSCTMDLATAAIIALICHVCHNVCVLMFYIIEQATSEKHTNSGTAADFMQGNGNPIATFCGSCVCSTCCLPFGILISYFNMVGLLGMYNIKRLVQINENGSLCGCFVTFLSFPFIFVAAFDIMTNPGAMANYVKNGYIPMADSVIDDPSVFYGNVKRATIIEAVPQIVINIIFISRYGYETPLVIVSMVISIIRLFMEIRNSNIGAESGSFDVVNHLSRVKVQPR